MTGPAAATSAPVRGASPPEADDAATPGVCPVGQMLLYVTAGCSPPPAPECAPIPPPMVRLHCGCDGVTYVMNGAPWAHRGACADAGRR